MRDRKFPVALNDLLTEFDEAGYCPTTFCNDPEEEAKTWKEKFLHEIGIILNDNNVLKAKLKLVLLSVETVKGTQFIENMKNVLEIEKRNAVKEFARKCKDLINADYVNGCLNNHKGYLTEYDIDELLKEYESD